MFYVPQNDGETGKNERLIGLRFKGVLRISQPIYIHTHTHTHTLYSTKPTLTPHPHSLPIHTHSPSTLTPHPHSLPIHTHSPSTLTHPHSHIHTHTSTLYSTKPTLPLPTQHGGRGLKGAACPLKI